MLSSLWQIGGKLWGDLPSSFNYSIGDKEDFGIGSSTQIFTQYTGSSKTNREPVSIFVFDKKSPKGEDFYPLARNALQRLKQTRHPCILHLQEALETSGGIYIVTEAVRPLVVSEVYSDPAWGLRQITSATEFLNNDCQVAHGLISPLSVFVVDTTGDWRLGGFELVRPLSADWDDTAIRDHNRELAAGTGLNPPPVAQYKDGGVRLDRWGLGCLYCWTFTASKKQGQLSGRECVELNPSINMRSVPQSLQNDVEALLNVSLSPVDLKGLMAAAVFRDSTCVQVLDFFETIVLKGGYDREVFFRRLPETLDTLPLPVQYKRVLPELTKQVERGAALMEILPIAMTIGDKLDTPLYRKHVMPIALKLFSSDDRAIRFNLLQNIAQFERHLDGSLAAEIFEPIAMGFTDSCAPLREATLKSMVQLFPLLKGHQADKALRLVQRLLTDPEPTIRTNSVICVAKITAPLNPSQASKVLYPVYAQALKDNVVPCRLAALQASVVTLSKFSAQEVATKLMPLVCVRMVDPAVDVRILAVSATEQMLSYVTTKLNEDESLQKKDTPVGSPQEAPGPHVGSQAEANGGPTDDGASAGWASWAWKKTISFTGKMNADDNTAVAPSPPGDHINTSTGHQSGAVSRPQSVPAAPTGIPSTVAKGTDNKYRPAPPSSVKKAPDSPFARRLDEGENGIDDSFWDTDDFDLPAAVLPPQQKSASASNNTYNAEGRRAGGAQDTASTAGVSSVNTAAVKEWVTDTVTSVRQHANTAAAGTNMNSWNIGTGKGMKLNQLGSGEKGSLGGMSLYGGAGDSAMSGALAGKGKAKLDDDFWGEFNLKGGTSKEKKTLGSVLQNT